MKDRTVLTVTALVCLTALAIAALAVQRDAVILGPTISAILIIMGYEGKHQARE